MRSTADPAEADRGRGAEAGEGPGEPGQAHEAGEGAVGAGGAVGGDDRALAGRARQAEGRGRHQGAAGRVRNELENAKRQGNLQRAGELAYGIIPGLEKELEEAEKRGSEVMVEEAVTPEQIARGGRALDRDPGRPDAGGRARQAAADGDRNSASG